MKTLILIVLAATGAVLLHLEGPNEPEWLPSAVFFLFLAVIAVTSAILEDTVNNDADEHRNNSI